MRCKVASVIGILQGRTREKSDSFGGMSDCVDVGDWVLCVEAAVCRRFAVVSTASVIDFSGSSVVASIAGKAGVCRMGETVLMWVN